MSELSFRKPQATSLVARPRTVAGAAKPRLLILIVAYNAETTIQDVLARVPPSIADDYAVEVLVIDDASTDDTFERGHEVAVAGDVPVPAHGPVQPGQPGLRRQPEDRLFLRHPERLRFRRPAPRRRAVRARMPAGPAPPVAGRRGGCVLRLAHDGEGGGAQRRDAALQVRRQPHPELVREPDAADVADRVPLRLPALLRSGAEAGALRAKHQRLPLRHGDHHPAPAGRPAHRRAPDPDLLRRRDLPRERAEIRLGRRQVGAEDARPGTRACSTTGASTSPRPEPPTSSTASRRITTARMPSRCKRFRQAPASSISAAPAATWARS